MSRIVILSLIGGLCSLWLASLSFATPTAGLLGDPNIEGSMLHFKLTEGSKLPPTLNTQLFDLKYLGELPPAEGTPLPYVMMIGKPCQRCENQQGVFMMRADGAKSAQFVHPGKVLDPKTRALLYESRAFFGQCLPGGESGYIAFQKERVDRRRGLPNSVFIAKPGPQFIEEKLLERRLPSLNSVIKQVKQKRCFEIAGSNRLMMKKKIDIIPKRGADPSLGDAAEEDDSIKENQTDQELKAPNTDS